MGNRILTSLLAIAITLGVTGIPVVVLAQDYPDAPVAIQQDTYGDYALPENQPSWNPDHVSDAIVSINVTGANFLDVLMILTSQAGVNFVLDAYWNTTPSGHVREGYRPPGGPEAGGGGGGYGGGGGFDPGLSSGGSVTMSMSEVPFDMVFKQLMQAYNLNYVVFRDAPNADPILYIGTRERLEQELGLGQITIYSLHYIDPIAAMNFLWQMDLMPTTSGYGYWYYNGGNQGGSGGGGGGQGGGGFGGGGSSGGGGGGFGGGGYSEGLWTAPSQFAVLGLNPEDLEGRSIL